MPPLLRRSRPALLIASLLLVASAAACSSDPEPDGDRSSARLDAVRITGDVGSAPEVDWKTRMSASSIETDTLVEGDGPDIADGQSVLAQVWIGNGFSEKQSYSSYDEGTAQVINSSDTAIPAIKDALTDATIGSRVAVTAAADEAFGSPTGNPDLGIGNQDSVLLILDLVSPVAAGPDGAQTPPPEWAPKVVETEGNPSSLDFSAAPQPVGKFRKAVLYAGTGERVRKNMTVAVSYLGQTYVGTQPFNENFSTTPSTFQIGVGSVIEGWDKMVVGSNVGSRILIEVPPKLGYGAAGSAEIGVTATDTLFFVIDILAAA